MQRHYERMKPCPDGFVVIGDALCHFNPIYAQGMSAAAPGACLSKWEDAGGNSFRGENGDPRAAFCFSQVRLRSAPNRPATCGAFVFVAGYVLGLLRKTKPTRQSKLFGLFVFRKRSLGANGEQREIVVHNSSRRRRTRVYRTCTLHQYGAAQQHIQKGSSMQSKDPPLTMRTWRPDVRSWLEERAARNLRTLNSEMLAVLLAEKERDERALTKLAAARMHDPSGAE
jgi:hypothetical protein